MAKVEKSYEAVCDFMARDLFLDSCSRELYVHLKPKTFKNLDEMAREADLFAEARGGVSSCIAKGQRKNKDNKNTHKNESSRPGNKPKIKCRICRKPHLTYKSWNNPDRKVASGAEIISDGGRLVTASSAETNSMQIMGDNTFHRGRGSNRSRGFGRGNNRGYGRSIVNKKWVREKSRECHNHKPQPIPDIKRKRKQTKPNKRKSNKRTKSTKTTSLFAKRGNREV